MDLMKIVDVLKENATCNYKDDIAIICLYGSFIQGTAHSKSDIDFYFIPKTNRGYELAKAFIINDVGFDFWAISWERAESIAAYKQGFVSLIADAQVIWQSTAGDKERFEKLRKSALAPTINFHERVKELYSQCEHQYCQICTSFDFPVQKQIASKLVTNVLELLALLNHTYTHRGWRHSIEEVNQLDIIPLDFSNKCKDILYSTDGNELQKCICNLLVQIQDLNTDKTSSITDFKNAFAGFYEEAKSIYNKLYHACDISDGITAIMAGAALQQDIMDTIGIKEYKKRFSDIVGMFNPSDLNGYKKAVEYHEKDFQTFLSENEVTVCHYETYEHFEKEMRTDK
ncbi:hypothetical protein SDC9_85927 [bioreactor metagenome]|uniref:Polymerase beta nucleotidyltransferase domain-containing protein n=1 Tax=bioreactor metagenome TaxID=1076179 RepID=A0A644ZNK2_9ZZZZ